MRNSKVLEMIGQKFGRLSVKSINHRNKNWQYYLNCVCDCGNKRVVRDAHLKSGQIRSCGCLQKELLRLNLRDKKFGKLCVLELHSLQHRNTYWLCKCDCGKTCVVKGYYLVTGHTKSCGCLLPIHALDFGESSFKALVRRYKDGAKKRNLSFRLSKKEIRKLFSGNCFYCNVPPLQINRHPEYNGNFTYNGIDRLDSTKGYSKDNCVSCCKVCNWMKGRFSLSEFLEFVRRIYETRIRK